MNKLFGRVVLVASLVLSTSSLAYSFPYVCTPEHAATPSTQNETTKGIVKLINELAGGPFLRTMAFQSNNSYEFCWMMNEGQAHPSFAKGVGTMFWNGTVGTTKASGVIYTIDMLNRVLKVAGKPEAAVLPAVFVLYHEFAHGMIHYGRESGELARVINHEQVLFWTRPLAQRYKGRAEQLLAALNGNTWGAETFADCFGAFLMGGGLYYQADSATQTFYERLSRIKFNEENFNASMMLAASLASQLVGQDEHGTVAERQSFVKYGLNVTKAYLPMMRINADRASHSAILACADMAYEQSTAKAAFKKKWGINGEFLARPFDSKLGF